MGRLDYIDGERVENAALAAGSAGVLYGRSAFTRMRACMGPDGNMRLFALDGHINRTAAAARLMFGESHELRGLMFVLREWLLRAVREYVAVGGATDMCYLHFGVGPFQDASGMLKSDIGTFSSYMFVEEQPPLYGRGLYATHDPDWPRPWDILSSCKTASNYGALAQYKDNGRARVKKLGVVVPDDCAVETVLMDEYSGRVAEYGCANAGAIIGNKVHLARITRRFIGLTEQAVLVLAERHLGLKLEYDLSVEHLAEGGFSMGTAGGVVPLVWYEGKPVQPNPTIGKLQQLYLQLRHGLLPQSKAWTTVVPL